MNLSAGQRLPVFNAGVLYKIWPYLVGLWLVFGLIQAAHFHWYYDQAVLLSLKWGLRDWLLWLLVACCFYRLVGQRFGSVQSIKRMALWFILMTCVAGAMQLLLVVVVDLFTDGISRPFFADFWHLYKKRWFQNILIFLILWFIIHQLLLMLESNKTQGETEHQSTAVEPVRTIKITDGKQHIWLEVKDIIRIEVTGNYLCFFTANGQHVTRGTMKEQAAQLAAYGFIQVNRSGLVNLSWVTSCERVSPSQVKVNLKNHDAVVVSRRFWPQVKHQLGV